MKIKKPYVHFIIKNIFDRKWTLIFYQKYFHGKMDFKLFYLLATKCRYTESYVVLADTNEQILFQYYCFNSIVTNFCNQKRKRLFIPNFQIKQLLSEIPTTWKVSRYRVFSGPYFLISGLYPEIYFVNLRI